MSVKSSHFPWEMEKEGGGNMIDVEKTFLRFNGHLAKEKAHQKSQENRIIRMNERILTNM